MKHLTSRRNLLIAGLVAAGAASGIATTEKAMADDQPLRGTVRFAEGAVLPKGNLRFHFEGLSGSEGAQQVPAVAIVESDGKTDRLSFALPLPGAAETVPVLLLVASLERSDGWLLARGTAKVRPGDPADITLYPVVY